MGNYTKVLENVSNPPDIVVEAVKQTDGVFPIAVLVSLFIVSFIAMRKNGREVDEILIYVGAFEILLTAFFIVMEWLAFYWLMLPVGMLFAGIVINRVK